MRPFHGTSEIGLPQTHDTKGKASTSGRSAEAAHRFKLTHYLILPLLAESVGQQREAAVLHPHREVVVTPFVASLFASQLGHSEAVRVSIAIAGVVPIIGALLWIGVSPNREVRQLES
jgi:hypothetical protein